VVETAVLLRLQSLKLVKSAVGNPSSIRISPRILINQVLVTVRLYWLCAG